MAEFERVLVGSRSGYGAAVSVPSYENNVDIPERWGSGELREYTDVLKEVHDYLSAGLGTDASERVPTHTITDEQRKLLASRNDLEALKNSTGDGTPQLAQLFGDLFFLNVMSEFDISHTMSPLPPISEDHTSWGIFLGDIDNFPKDNDPLLERLEKHIEINSRVFAMNKDSWSKDYIEEFKGFINALEECHKVLSDLFGEQ